MLFRSNLGDGFEKMKQIYGNKFEDYPMRTDAKPRMDFTGVSEAYRRVTFQWRREEFTLTVGLNEKGTISAMWLILPECYPDGCE